MSERQQQLRERFRASAEARLLRCVEELISAASSETAKVPASVKREIHTLKGEARLLDLLALSQTMHTTEDVLAASEASASSAQASSLLATTAEALSVIAAILHEGCASEEEYRQALHPVEAQLQQLCTPGADAGSTATADARSQSSAPAPPATSADAAQAPAADRPLRRERWLQVSADQVDLLFGNISEFSSATRVLHDATRRLLMRQGAISHEARALLEDFDRLGSQLDDIESAAWTLRMVPIEPALRDLGQHAKDLAAQIGKDVRLLIDSGRSQIERVVLDALWEPLLHLVRNAVDHGLEPRGERGSKPTQGTLSLRAESVGRTIVVTVSDDGRGILPQSIRESAVRRGLMTEEVAATASQQQLYELLFVHGFSTSGGISDLSGRGVGLDVVRDRLTALGGEVALESTPGSGTQITLTLPARLSKERAVLFQIGGMLYALPGRSVLEILSLAEQDVQPVAGGLSVKSRYGTLPLSSLARTLGATEDVEETQVIIIRAGSEIWALSVSRILMEMELERQPCDPLLASVSSTYASALLDNGRSVLWLLAGDLLRLARQGRTATASKRKSLRKRQVLIVDDSAVLRELLVEIFKSAGYDVVSAANGQEALAVCERSLPDAALVDVEMPVLDGFGFLQAARPRWPKLPVMMFTSRTSAEYRARAMNLGANAYLIKTDFDESRLVESMNGLLRGAG